MTYVVQAQLYGPYRTMQGPLVFTQVFLFFSIRVLLHQFQTSPILVQEGKKTQKHVA